MNRLSTALRGEVKVEVLQDGKVIESRPWQRNLITDRGLDTLASVPVPDLFLCAVKAQGDGLAMSEVLTGTNAMTAIFVGGAGGTLTNTGGRDFTAADIGKVGSTTVSGNLVQFRITDWPGGKVAYVENVGQTTVVAFTGKTVTLYRVNKDSMDDASAVPTETTGSRTTSYSGLPGDNYTTDALNVRTHQRAFLFASEPAKTEVRTCFSGGFAWSGTAITKGTDGAPFTSADIGSYIEFLGQYAKITATSSAGNSSATADRAAVGSLSNSTVTIHGFNSYAQIGFSESETVNGANLNVNIKLTAPVLALGAIAGFLIGQQVKVTYRLIVTYTPFNITSSFNPGISDTTPPATGTTNKNGTAVLENLIGSTIGADGETNLASAGLDPSVGGYMALSTVSTALHKLSATTSPPDRSEGAAYAALTADLAGYVNGSYSILKSGTFLAPEALALTAGSAWRVLGLYDPDTQLFAYTFLFAVGQKKPGTHAYSFRFRSTWDRDLSA